MPLLSKDVDEVLVQAYYMSGDRNAIASALRLKPRLGVVVLAPEGALEGGKELKAFYAGVAGPARVALHAVPLKGATGEAAVKEAYKWVADYVGYDRKDFPKWIGSSVGFGVKLRKATWGTQVIADAFKLDKTGARSRVRDLWRLNQVTVDNKSWRPTYEDLQPKVADWLQEKGFQSGRRYVILFAKQALVGDKLPGKGQVDWHAEKAHHFTSVLTWRILQERIERETSVIPVAAGDRIGLKTLPDMVRFWEDESWKKIFAGHQIDPRAAQLGMWCFLAERFGGLSIVGMRSGMIEVPALLGIRTLYLEEKHNQQAKRMMKWVGTVPGYERQQVDVPGGIAQQLHWKEQSAKAPYSSDVAKQARTLGANVSKLVLGFEKGKLGQRPPDLLDGKTFVDEKERAQALAAAVFGRGGLAPELPASKFMLASGEFDAIVRWVNNGATGTPVAHGNVKAEGKLERRDSVRHDLTARRETQSWSDYFASPDYRKRFEGLKLPSALADA